MVTTAPPPTVPRAQLVPATSPVHPFQVELRFTETYLRHRDAPVALREARCLEVQAETLFQPIRTGDLLAGRVLPGLVGFSPDEWGGCAFGFYHLPKAIREAMAVHSLAPETHRRVQEMLAFWDEESTAARVRRAYPPELAAYLPSDDWMDTPGVAFPLYRLTGGNVDYEKLMRLGLPGLAREVEHHRQEAADRGQDPALLEGLAIALNTLVGVCRRYENEARHLAELEPDRERQAELEAMARALANLREAPPQTFREAAQLFWLYALLGDIRNHGRMDVYLGGFLARDLDAGVLTEAEALRLLQSLWRLMADRETRVHNRVIVGGLGRPDEASADRFALLAMEATRTVHEPEPQLSLRFYEGMDPALMERALDVIAEGRTFPMLYNDEVNVPSVMAAFGVGRAEAEQYVPFGCGEYVLEHRSLGTPSGVINLLKALEVTLYNGVDPTTGRPMGLALGGLADFGTFEALWEAYARQVEHHVRLLAEQQALEYRVAGEQAAFLLHTLLYDDCLERGRALLDGGVRYLGGTLETYGNTNAADSLTALKALVYDSRRLTPAEALAALADDFAGHDRTRRLLQDAPKYGNDDDRADAMLLRVHDHVCGVTRAQAERVGLHSYLVVVINNAANTLLGHGTGASPEGRQAGTPMNNGNAPSSGNDRKGMTAMLNSIAKPATDTHAGAVQNLKFSPELFRTRRPELRALLETYFARGGAQAMITVVRRGDLEAAMATPELYPHVFVRVGGFSARFIDLSRDVQLEILQRTLY
jgi:pyruvate-formate lyase